MSEIKKWLRDRNLMPQLDKQGIPECFKKEPIWGVITIYESYFDTTTAKPRKVIAARIVTNTTSFHPKSILGSNLTHAEAEAIVKLHNSGAQHGTD